MPTEITIVGTISDLVTVGNSSVVYRPVPVKGQRYYVDLQPPEPPKSAQSST